MKKWEIIREAKKYLALNIFEESWNVGGLRKMEHVCNALDKVYVSARCRYKINDIKHHIQMLLGQAQTYNSWLLDVAKLPEEIYNEDEANGYPKRQAGRLAWMNWMQAYYKNLDE